MAASTAFAFLFADVPGSGRLWEEQPTAMRTALESYDTIMRWAVREAGGTTFKRVGEQFFSVFPNGEEAAAAAVAAARALQVAAWATSAPLPVRMAVHYGPAEIRAADFFGQTLNRTARLLAAGHPGQILVSAAAKAQLPPLGTNDSGSSTAAGERLLGVRLRSLGEHRLKDLVQPEEVFDVLAPDLPNDFPPLRSLEAFAHNLPIQLTSFVGREDDLAQVGRRLGDTRLLTLSGPGGTGKTRLALQAAADALDQFTDGVWLVELAALTDPKLVPAQVAGVLGVREVPGRPLQDVLAESLRTRRLLILIDNCEHLAAAVADLAGFLLRGCPGVQIMATSREGLGVFGETIIRVPPLTLPDPRHLPPLDQLATYEAVHLFLDRAQAVQPDFRLTEANAPAIAAICTRLDGIPLALELAAARVRILPPGAIMARLEDRFRLLTGGSRTALPRQQTLRALIDWSWDLLPESEQILWRRLSVFQGGWTLAAAEIVGSGLPLAGTESWNLDPVAPLSVSNIFEDLANLAGKSLVTVDSTGRKAHYHFLETIREYGLLRLTEAGEADTLRSHHLAWCVALAEEAGPGLDGPQQGEWLDRLETEHDNLRAALGWALDHGPIDAAARILIASTLFWLWRGHWTEARRWLDAVLQQSTSLSPTLRAWCLRYNGRFSNRQGDVVRARELDEASLALFRTLDDEKGIASALAGLTDLAIKQGDYTTATAHLQTALAISRRLGDKIAIAERVGNLGQLALGQDDYQLAYQYCSESLTLFQELGDDIGVATEGSNLGYALIGLGDYAAAIDRLRDSIVISRKLDDPLHIALALSHLGLALLYTHDLVGAANCWKEALMLYMKLDEKSGLSGCLLGLAAVALTAGDADRAAWLLGAVEAVERDLQDVANPLGSALRDQVYSKITAQLDPAALTAAQAKGVALPLDQVVDYAYYDIPVL